MNKTLLACLLCATFAANAREPTPTQWSVAGSVMAPIFIVLSVPASVVFSGAELSHYSTGKLAELTYDNQPWEIIDIRQTDEGPKKDWRHVTLTAKDKDLQVTVRVPANLNMAVGDTVTSHIKTRPYGEPVMSFHRGTLVMATLYDAKAVHQTKRID